MLCRVRGAWRRHRECPARRKPARPRRNPVVILSSTDSGTTRLAILDSDSGFVRVLVNRLESHGWQYRRLEAAPRIEEFVAMRVNALVVDLALLGPGAWEFLERLAQAMPGLGAGFAKARAGLAQ